MAYTPLILTNGGYESLVRSRLGATENELPDSEINQDLVLQVAETVVIRRVPGYALIADSNDLLFLKLATISYICYLLCPSMSRRVKTEVATIDMKWKKDKVDWDKKAEGFLTEFETAIANIQSVEAAGGTYPLMMIATTAASEES